MTTDGILFKNNILSLALEKLWWTQNNRNDLWDFPSGTNVKEPCRRYKRYVLRYKRSLAWEDPLEKEMAAHSSILAWRIPWTEKPGRLQSVGLQRVGHDWSYLAQASLVPQLEKNPPAMQEARFDSWVRKIPWRRRRLPTSVFLGFPGGLVGKEFACSAGDLGLIPVLGRCPGEGDGYPLQYSGLENPTDRGAWQATGHRVAKSCTRLSNFYFQFSLSTAQHIT